MRRLLRIAFKTFGVLVLLLLVAVGVGIGVAWEAMGTAPDGERLARMERSTNHRDGIFVNIQPMWTSTSAALSAMWSSSEVSTPPDPVPVRTDTLEQLATAPGPLRVTWLGHSTLWIELEGAKILTDPVFGEATSPIEALGPQRFYPPPAPLEAFAEADVVLISHDHYDHLDHPTMLAMRDWDTKFVAPLGVGAHLEYWGISADRIVEVDWWDELEVAGVRIVSTPSRHASGRHVFDQNRTLWTSYALIGANKRVMFSGDTGIFDGMAEIGERLGPFDIVMMEVGAYHQAWPDWHMGPEQALVGHQMLKGRLFMPIHWGLFNLAPHGWTEPIERVWKAANDGGIAFVAPQPGEVFRVDAPPPPERWWPELPWNTAEVDPIIATRGGDTADRYPAPVFERAKR